MDLKPLFEVAKRFANNNTAGILTGIGAAGAVTSVLLTGRAAFRVGMDASTQYHEEVERRYDQHGNGKEPLPVDLLSTKHLVTTYWKEFVPPAIVGAISVTAIIAANRVGARKQAALVAALKLTDELRTEYREKVVATLGKEKEEKMHSDVVRERIENLPSSQVIVLGGTQFLFYDAFSGRAFACEMEEVKRAVNEINYRVNNYGWASLSDFYGLIGVEKTEVSDEFGWKQDELLDPMFTYVGLSDGRPACQIDFNTATIRSFHRLH
jgi:hypothetical protein